MRPNSGRAHRHARWIRLSWQAGLRDWAVNRTAPVEHGQLTWTHVPARPHTARRALTLALRPSPHPPPRLRAPYRARRPANGLGRAEFMNHERSSESGPPQFPRPRMGSDENRRASSGPAQAAPPPPHTAARADGGKSAGRPRTAGRIRAAPSRRSRSRPHHRHR
jgi:hypothetical protein